MLVLALVFSVNPVSSHTFLMCYVFNKLTIKTAVGFFPFYVRF